MKVLVIEDDAEIVEFISIAFDVGWQGTKLISSHQGKVAVELVEKETPDMVILDLGLPDVSGFEVLKDISRFSDIPVIITTVRDSEADIVKGLDLGADEYIVKPFGQLELLARVKAVLRGRKHCLELQEPIILGPLKFDPASCSLSYGSRKIHLTRTECLIIHELISNAGHLATYSQLAEAVWGDYYPNASDTLRVYIRRLRAKIEIEPECQRLIHARPGLGYLIELPSSAS